VYLGDSVRWEQDKSLLSQGGITIHTSDGMELFEQELHFPEGVVGDADRFDRLVADLANRAADRKPIPKRGSRTPDISGLLNRHHVTDESDREAVDTVFRKLCLLHDAGRNHVWAYYIRNLARPLAFTRPEGQADVLIGNPPWLAYRHMPERLQSSYRSMAEARGLWAGGKVATHQDLSDLFVARAVEQYLTPSGTFAFVMPFSVLSRRQYAGFRSGDWSLANGDQVRVAFLRPEEFARIKPPLFPVPSCVITGAKAQAPATLPPDALVWTGRVAEIHTSWAMARKNLSAVSQGIAGARDVDGSPYRSSFSQGATLVPRMLVTLERNDAGPLGMTAGRVSVKSARSANEKAPWKELRGIKGVVEEQFIRPMHLGATIVAFRAREPELAIIPWADEHLLDGNDPKLDEYDGLASWWREAEQIWNRNRTASSKLSLRERVDFQRGLSRQFPIPKQRVVYTKSGQHLAACRVQDDRAVIDHKLYWAAFESVPEARYLTTLLNSQVVASAVAPLQARGQHNPRDFDLHIFALPLPVFEASDHLHEAIADLGKRAEEVASKVPLDATWQFQKCRRATRDALREDGVAGEIDDAVAELLAGISRSHPDAV
jgi:hypothetical protein